MGNFLEAIYHTGYYYTIIGVLQVAAAVLLLIPRTAILGVFIYLPIILNICILSMAVRFEGSLLTSPLMVLANLYLLGWYYHKWKYILPFNQAPVQLEIPRWKDLSNMFPLRFFAGVVVTVVVVAFYANAGYDIYPRNTLSDCKMQCEDSDNPQACYKFCDAIHKEGQTLDKSLEGYYKESENSVQKL